MAKNYNSSENCHNASDKNTSNKNASRNTSNKNSYRKNAYDKKFVFPCAFFPYKKWMHFGVKEKDMVS